MNRFREISKVQMLGSKMTHLFNFGHNKNFSGQSKTFTFNHFLTLPVPIPDEEKKLS